MGMTHCGLNFFRQLPTAKAVFTPSEQIFDIGRDTSTLYSLSRRVRIGRSQPLVSEDVKPRHGDILPSTMPERDKPRDLPLNAPRKSARVHGSLDARIVDLSEFVDGVRETPDGGRFIKLTMM